MMLVEQCRSSDKMWLELGIDQEEMEEAIMRHKLNEDPQFRKTMQEYITKI